MVSLGALVFAFGVAWAEPGPPAIASLVPKGELQAMLEDRGVFSRARLEEIPLIPTHGVIERYSFGAAMLVHASLGETRKVLTDYQVYAKMVPYIDLAEFNVKSGILRIQGGIFKYVLSSEVKFEEVSERWIRYRIVAGHFRGLAGDFYFEPAGEKGTLVYFGGAIAGGGFPPRFVIERGAEIVFGFTAKRMRSYVESQKGNQGGAPNDRNIPEPRSRL